MMISLAKTGGSGVFLRVFTSIFVIDFFPSHLFFLSPPLTLKMLLCLFFLTVTFLPVYY